MTLRDSQAAVDYRHLGHEPVLITGLQALVRLLLLQAKRDSAAGLDTAGFVSGYRGSPLGALDIELSRSSAALDRANIRFEPGINEELAATAIWGSQQANLFEDARYDGVFGLWYGKGPGIDRSGDALKHANAAGSSRYGGVLVAAGDDHGCKSSTIVQQSEFAFIDAMMPVLNPADVADILELGLHGYALSRYSACWVAMIITQETADASQSVALDVDQFSPIEPTLDLPDDGLHIRWPDSPLVQEQRLHAAKLPAALEYARVNKLNRPIWSSTGDRYGIVATGKAFGDLMQALARLGIDAERAAGLGLRVLKVGMSWPLEPSGIAEFVAGLDEVFVVEEKRAVIEPQIKEQLYGLRDDRPRIVGKHDEEGAALLPSTAELTPALIARALANRLARLDASGAIARRASELGEPQSASLSLVESGGRMPHFCSGCPHNTSTRVPDGSRAAAGIGCHFMALWMDRSTTTFTQMGGEGATWIGQAPFVATQHIFQNLGDGTYMHSGLLAIRAAVAAGVNITYKILYNDAVAMTGGQPVEGGFSPAQIAQQLIAEGVGRVVIVADDLERYAQRSGLPGEVEVFAREKLDLVQRQLREHAGVSALIFDQACAAETRRKRKRGLAPVPPRIVEIHPEVCEGCGDCNLQSNCLSVVALETELGRKRSIDQSACNRDYSCLQGFCPSFVTVTGAERRVPTFVLPDDVPPPPTPSSTPCNIVIAGVGGTGVVTAGRLLGLAAHLQGRDMLELAQTGLAQKFGAVLSHVRVGAAGGKLTGAPRVAEGEADLLLASDLLVAAAQPALSRIAQSRSAVIANSHRGLPPSFIHERDLQYPAQALLASLRACSDADRMTIFDATHYASELLGDALLANVVMLGAALQRGLLPVSLEALERALDLLGQHAAANRAALALGRYAAHDAAAVDALCRGNAGTSLPLEALEDVIAYRVAFLERYQDAAYATRYQALVERAQAAESRVCGAPGQFTMAVARTYFQLLAYKDEYEVARLYTQTDFLEKLKARYSGTPRLEFQFSLPLISGIDPVSGRPRKRTFGPWIVPILRLLARARVLRGGPFDLFALTPERRLERALLGEFEAMLDELLTGLDSQRITSAISLVDLWREIRGFGPVKAAAAQRVREQREALLAQWR